MEPLPDPLDDRQGDWGLGIGDWGLGIGPQSPIPNPQSPIPIANYLKHIISICTLFFYIIPFLSKLIK